VIDYETYVRIRNYVEQEGLNHAQIARELSLDERTVARWAVLERYRQRKGSQRKSKLDSFKPVILRMLERHP
jgi:ribosome-binding protein aMBF1 (putative translation factor)